MKGRIKIFLTFMAAAIYVLAWLMTYLQSAAALRRELVNAFEKRPVVVDAHLLLCPVPFVFKAEWEYKVPDVESGAAEGWYLLTPWKVYTLRHRTTASL